MFLTLLGYLFTALAYLLLVIVIIVFTLLVVPYHYRVTGEKFEKSTIEGSITWLFGGINIDFIRTFPGSFKIKLTLFQLMWHTFEPRSSQKSNKKHSFSPKDQQAKENSTNTVKTSEATQKNKRSSGLAREFLKPAILKKAFSTLLKILKHFQPRTLVLNAKFGFDDPMVTGLLCGLLSQFDFLIQKHEVRVQPVFEEEILEGKILIGGRVWIPSLLMMILGFLISKPVRSIYIPKLLNKIKKTKGGPQYVNSH